MTNIIKSVESNNITIKKFKVQGLDLIVTTPNGTVEKIENGLSEIISGGIVLLTEQGNVLSQDEILSSITMNIGADAIYLKEQFISETIELAEDIDTKKDEDDEEKQFAEKLAELNQENQKLAKEVQALESQTEKQEEQLSSSLTKLSEAKAQLKEQIKSEKSKKESVSDPALPPSPPPMPAKSSTSSESSTPANKTPENPIVIKPKTQVFIQGKLSEESDFSSVCYGFQVFQISTWGTSYGTLLPSAACGVVPPSNTSCNFSFPTSIDLGSAVSGQNGFWSGEATGAFSCTNIVDIRASLLATPYLSNLPVDISVNQVSLDINNKSVARGQIAPLNFKATTTGKFTSAGKFNANAVILFSFN